MTRPPYIVDGVDFTDYVNRWQYSVGYVYREGSNAALRLSGLQPRDLLAIKTRVSVTVNDQQGPQLAALLADAPEGYPYQGAKLHYILDIENRDLVRPVIDILVQATPLPKKRRRPAQGEK